MKIFKCDHCGKEIQNYETEFEVTIGKSYDSNQKWCRRIDLCDDCLQKVKEQVDLILFKEKCEEEDED